MVEIIAGLTREEFCVHIWLQRRPATFADLRRIAEVLDPLTSIPACTVKSETTGRKILDGITPTGSAVSPCTFNTQRKPPSACKYCGGDTTDIVSGHTNPTFRETTGESVGPSPLHCLTNNPPITSLVTIEHKNRHYSWKYY